MIRSLLGKFWLLCAGLIVLFAVLLTLARLLLPHAGIYHDEIEEWVSHAIGQPVAIGTISGDWHGLGPRLVLREVSLLDGESDLPLAHFSRAGVDLDLVRSVLHAEPHIARFVLTGVRLTVERDNDGSYLIAGRGWGHASDDEVDDERRSRLISWALDQGRLAIEGAEVTWIDPQAADGEAQVFSTIDLELRNDRGRHQVDGAARLPPAFGERIAFAIDLIGDPLGEDWQARTWLRGSALAPAAWLAGRPFGGVRVDGGESGFEIWTQWLGGRLITVDGRVDISGLRLAAAADEAAGDWHVDSLAGVFRWLSRDDGWRVDVDRLAMVRNGVPRPLTGMALSWQQHGEQAPVIQAHADTVRVEDVVELLLLGEWTEGRVREALERLAPAGEVSDLDLVIGGSAGERRIAVEAGFADFHNRPWSGIPGGEAVSGRLAFDNVAGHVDLDIGVGRLDFDDLFREPLPVESLRGRVSWARADDGWRVVAEQLDLVNDDLNLVAWGRLDLPVDEAVRPSIALFARFDARTVENTSLYLPTRIMPPTTVDWLDRAILGGTSPRGDLVLHGPLKGFPYIDGSGRFKVDFDLEQGRLAYHPEWPRLEEIAAQVTFEGPGMSIAARDGRSFDTRISRAQVDIANLNGRPAVLTVDGEAEGLTVDALRFLQESPLATRFGAYADEAEATGPARLALRLGIPLDGSPPAVDGDLDFVDSTLSLYDRTIDITAINGRLNFTGTGISADAIAARILGLPARVSISPRLEDGSAGTLIKASGTADDRGIAGLLDLAPLRYLEGRTDWQARLRLPFAAEDGDEAPGGAMLEIESTLVGLAFTLPAPMTKPAASTAPLRISIPLPRSDGGLVSLAIGDMLTAVLLLDDDHRPERGELRFGGGETVLPERRGLRLSGHADELTFEEWSTVFTDGEAGGDAGEDARSDIGEGNITALDLRIDRASLFGRDFHQAHIDAIRDAGLWRAEVASEEMAGRLEVPLRDGSTWRLRLKHLHLAAAGDPEEGDGRVVDPRNLPPLRIESEDFSYGGIDFGRLDLVSSRRDAGMRLDRLSLSSPQQQVEARGDWVVAGERQFSSFTIGFTTEDFGAALSNFGYAGTIRDGKGVTDINARWHGPPTAFALSRLDGWMEMRIDNGRLLEVEPGAGRIFGLISLQALPRRLTLDFSDFFGRGFSFDRINGSFTVREGVAITDNLAMAGPAARVEARGRIDLGTRQYDQVVDVYPNVTSGLPVAGMVAGGLGVGAAILLAERIFRPDIDRMTRISYRVTGPWSDPEVQRLQDDDQSGKR